MEFIRGRRGAVVFFERFKKQFLREYVVPANPQTFLQQQFRFSFRFINKIYLYLQQPLFDNIWDTASDDLNPHNIFVRSNQNSISKELNFDSVSLSVGILEPIFLIKSIQYKDAANRCMFKWDSTIINNGSPTDKILLILIDYSNYLPDQNKFLLTFYYNSDKQRQDSVGFIIPEIILNTDFLHGFIIVFNDPINNKYQISDSLNKKVIPF